MLTLCLSCPCLDPLYEHLQVQLMNAFGTLLVITLSTVVNNIAYSLNHCLGFLLSWFLQPMIDASQIFQPEMSDNITGFILVLLVD
jgi:hypothetical protein